MQKTIFAAAIAAVVAANSNADDTAGIFGDSDQWKTGTVVVDSFKDDIFYWVFDSRSAPETDPLVLWLTGGPGCASEVALFFENGPYMFNDEGALETNPNSWNDSANLLYVDQPIGTGFSNGSVHDTRNETEVAEDMAKFLKGFVAANPEYAGRDFYITGESYAGHYVPAIAYYLEFVETELDLSLKGIAIGNGLTDPYEQYPAYATFSYENDLISENWYNVLTNGFETCQGLIAESQASGSRIEDIKALEFCQILADTCIGSPLNPHFNVYDIRIPCESPPLCYDFSVADTFLNRADVQEVLGVPGRTWEDCNMLVHTFLLGDWMTNLMPQVARILDETNVEVLVYSGDKDWICNWRGGEAWTLQTEWANKTEFQSQDYQSWNVNGVEAGQMRQYGNLHFLRVFDAGHMVPMDQPENALAMIQRFVANDWELETVEGGSCPWEFGPACYMQELCGTGCTAGCNWSWPAGSDMDDPQTDCRCMDCSTGFNFTQ